MARYHFIGCAVFEMKYKEIKKAARKISRNEILAVYQAYGGSAESFCVLRRPGDRIGTVYFADSTGRLLTNLDGDEVFDYAFQTFLEELHVPVFESLENLIKFEGELQRKIGSSRSPKQ